MNSTIPFLDLAALHATIAADWRAAMDTVLAHGRFINGPEVRRFETEWAAAVGVPSAIGAANGTAALHAILACLGIGPGHEVILPSHTFVATAESVVLTGATPVFVEVDATTWLASPAAIAAAITPRTRAIIPVHLYGMPADMEAINAIGCSHGLPVIEDASQAHFATLNGRRAGALGLAAAFSFFPGKNLGAFGDAGGITTLDPALGRALRLYVNHGRESKYQHEMMGTNYRLDTLQAAILSAKLRHLEGWTARRRALAAAYRQLLGTDEFRELGLELQADTPGADSCWHLFVVSIPHRDAVQQSLEQAGIGTGIHYPIPVHLQPSMAPWSHGAGSLAVTERLADRILSLPMCPTLDATHAERVAEALRHALRRAATSPRSNT
jgi:dTDP-4-amino-4,6-dideoxygalactose transaminase